MKEEQVTSFMPADYVIDRQVVREYLDRVPARADFSAAESESLKRRIRDLLIKRNAVLVAHYYTAPELQALAEETGGCVADSLEMARFGTQSEAEVIMVAGVRFMGGTAK